MIRNLLLTTGIVLFASFMAFAQPGTLKGKLLEAGTNEPIPFANIVLENGGTQVGGTSTDFDGNYVIKPIPPGTYTLKASNIGYQALQMDGVIIYAGKIRFLDLEMNGGAFDLDEVVITSFKIPLIDKDKTSTGATVTAAEIAKMPNRNASAIATTVGGVFSEDGERGSVRGARSEETVTYIDGVKVIGSASLPASALEQVSVLLGGTPAMYGDVTGGVISITTKGPSRTFGGGLEVQTSQFLDSYGHNGGEFSLTGPLFKGKDETSSTSILGFFLAGNVTMNESGYNSAIGIDKATDSYLDYLHNTPVRPSGIGVGIYQNAEFMNSSQMENVKAAPNSNNISANASLKLDVKTSDNTTLTFGGSFNYSDGNNFNYYNSMFNSDNNSHSTGYTWRAYGRFTQRFPSKKESTSTVKNFYYSIQVDYSKQHNETKSNKFKDDLFKYGYLGKYTTHKIASFETAYDSITNTPNVQHLNNWDFDTLVEFSPYAENMALANHTSYYYDWFPNGHSNSDDIQLGGGLLNGEGPDEIYSGLWQAPGVVSNGNSIFDQNQLGVNFSAALDVGTHEVKFGFQYEQQQQRGISYAPTKLWELMRGLTNFHIREIDIDNPYLVYSDGTYAEGEAPSGHFLDTVLYYRKYDGESQRTFDVNLRKKLGLPDDGTDFIDIDSYDVDAQTINIYDRDGVMKTISVGEELFDISMFSADELYDGNSSLNRGAYATYYGYDYKGDVLKGKQSFDDFYTAQDENGDFLRHAGAYEPIYMAGYIQDKFDFNGDLVVSVGLRVDRFDANQLTLKDPYLFYTAKTVAELDAGDFSDLNAVRPGNIGDDYIVYVDKISGASAITGYRDGDTWFDENGAVIQDPNQLDRGAGVSPYLHNTNQNQKLTKDAFQDYEPQWDFLPRLSFSFPISDEALFFAHYDILTQRPFNNNRFVPSQYLNYASTGTFNNPNLRPKKTIDYELGFTQKLNDNSSLSIATYYKEIRNQVQYSRYAGAYPKDYSTYKNIDFGTVKGLTITYDLRRTKNVRVRAAYTLQFADGTGSSETTAAALVNSGLPNLRSVNPLGWDRRHAINIVLDYRYKGGKNYNGPVISRDKSGKTPLQLLANTGLSVTLNGGSGTPYTRSENVYALNSGSTNVLKGSYFGSRIPWTFRMDLRLDKDIYFKKKENGKQNYLNIYLSVNNVLNSQNITGVYAYTGNPDDDGYLTAPEWQNAISNQLYEESYRLLYESRMNTPGNYSRPRTIRLGLIFSF